MGQLLVAVVYGSGPYTATPAQRAANRAMYGVSFPAQVVGRWHLGGVMLIGSNSLDRSRSALSTGNVNGPAQIRSLTSGLQAAAQRDVHRPLLIAVDQEGGRVQRIKSGVTQLPSQARLGALGPAALTCTYQRLGRQLRALGINQDYAPVADVAAPSRGIIGDRSFGSNPSRDAVDVAAAVRGLQSAGVLATLKHWPGHGSTATDSHAALAVVHRSAAQWRTIDRVPFAAGAGAAAVMVGHLALPALDPARRPATLSPVLVRGLLRSGLGYRGLIVTDSLLMQPARAAGTPAQVALAALAAGDTMLLMSPQVPAVSAALVSALRRNGLAAQRIRAAAALVLAAKDRVRAFRPGATC